jgi:hypothetical protein
MARKRHTLEQIINKLRQAEVDIANGATVRGNTTRNGDVIRDLCP